MKNDPSLSPDARLIRDLGGPTKVAELLRYTKKNGPQRVQNWLTRGIPPAVKLQHPELFLRCGDVPDTSLAPVLEA